MKGTLDFDPRACDHSASVRELLVAWAEIDWFEPSGTSDADALETFRGHQRRAHAHQPDAFPLELDVHCLRGDREDFRRLCEWVRAHTDWDWKYGLLKNLSRAHTEARAWSPAPTAPRDVVPGTLYYAYGEQLIWIGARPKLADLGEAARFYLDYAHGDLLDAVQWQLAEGHDDLDDNPFWPLLQLYGLGAYPFSLGRDAVALFRFR